MNLKKEFLINEINVENGQKITKLYKYRTFCEFTNDIIKTSSLWYANPLTFNDPFDMNPSFRKKYSKREIKAHIKNFIKTSRTAQNVSSEVQEKYRRNYETLSNTCEKFVALREKVFYEQIGICGVLSLSKHNDSILMWSHYADNHKGLVFEFNYELQKVILEEFPHKVEYIKESGLLSHALMIDERKSQMMTILTTKYTDWSYEGEYRIINIGFQGNKPFDKKLLTKIIFGLKASTEDMQKMVKLCRENGFEHVVFEKAEKVEGTFALRMVPYEGY